MSNFKTEKNKLRKVNQTNEDNGNEIDRYIISKQVNFNSDIFNKSQKEVIIWDRLLLEQGDSFYTKTESYEFPTLPHDAINYIKVKFFVESDNPEIFSDENISYSPQFRYILKQLPNIGYIFQVYYKGNPSGNGGYPPLYLNLSLKILNERIWNAI